MTFDLDVVLAAHGAGNDSPANALVQEAARALERTMVGSRVTPAFVRGEPTYVDALQRADRPARVVLPLLTSEGYYAARLRRDVASSAPNATAATMLPPIGIEPDFVRAFVNHVLTFVARESLERSQPIVVVGHGTTRHARSGAATQAVVDLLRGNHQLAARAAYLDQPPSLEDALVDIGPDANVVVVPFLLGAGDHATADIRERAARVASQLQTSLSRIAIAPPLADTPALPQLLERMLRRTRTHRVTLNVGARASLLSQRQVAIVGAALAQFGVDLRFVAIDTAGDIDQATPIHDLGDDAFTDRINTALLNGDIDCAVHSLKDLPLSADPSIVSAAILPRGSVDETLVSRDNLILAALPTSARIGVSCARRAAQLRRLRHDVLPVAIRAPVPARVAAVDRGDVDAVVLAAAGLERLGLHDRIAQRFTLDEMVPAPAQGAIVVQCRAGAEHLALLAQINDRATRLAVQAELAFARQIARTNHRVAAASARVNDGVAGAPTHIGASITLRARIIDTATREVRDATTIGWDADATGVTTAEQLMRAGIRS